MLHAKRVGESSAWFVIRTNQVRGRSKSPRKDKGSELRAGDVMATGTIQLPVGGAILPDGSASNAAPGLLRVKSSAAAPSPYFWQLNFDASTEEQCYWSFRMPADYASAPVLKV